MTGAGLTGGEAVFMLVLGLIPMIVGLLLIYVVIRLAVRHALRDAYREGVLRSSGPTPRP